MSTGSKQTKKLVSWFNQDGASTAYYHNSCPCLLESHGSTGKGVRGLDPDLDLGPHVHAIGWQMHHQPQAASVQGRSNFWYHIRSEKIQNFLLLYYYPCLDSWIALTTNYTIIMHCQASSIRVAQYLLSATNEELGRNSTSWTSYGFHWASIRFQSSFVSFKHTTRRTSSIIAWCANMIILIKYLTNVWFYIDIRTSLLDPEVQLRSIYGPGCGLVTVGMRAKGRLIIVHLTLVGAC